MSGRIRWTIFLGLALLALGVVALRVGRSAPPPAPAAAIGEIPPHPYLGTGVEDLGVAAPEKPPANMLPAPLFNMYLAMPMDFEELLYLDECPMRRIGFSWNNRRRMQIYSPLDPQWTYERFLAVLETMPGDNLSDEARANLDLKAHLLPPDMGKIWLGRFVGNGLQGFMVDPAEPPVHSRQGHTATYYLFPRDGQPGMKVEVIERRDGMERTDSGVHMCVAAMSYPAPQGSVDERMRDALHAEEHGEKMEAVFGFLAAHCLYPREALGMLARTSLSLRRREIAREALRLLEDKNIVLEDREDLLKALARLDAPG